MSTDDVANKLSEKPPKRISIINCEPFWPNNQQHEHTANAWPWTRESKLLIAQYRLSLSPGQIWNLSWKFAFLAAHQTRCLVGLRVFLFDCCVAGHIYFYFHLARRQRHSFCCVGADEHLKWIFVFMEPHTHEERERNLQTITCQKAKYEIWDIFLSRFNINLLFWVCLRTHCESEKLNKISRSVTLFLHILLIFFSQNWC